MLFGYILNFDLLNKIMLFEWENFLLNYRLKEKKRKKRKEAL